MPAWNDLLGLELPETVIEYRNPPPSVCGHAKGIDLRLQQRGPEGAVLVVRVECGQVLRDGEFPYLEPCVRVRARNELGATASVYKSIDAESGLCLPVPEPDALAGLVVGLVAVVALWLRKENGRPPI